MENAVVDRDKTLGGKKLAMLKRQVKSASDTADKAKACVKLFKEQENA